MLNIDFGRELIKMNVLTESQLSEAKSKLKDFNGRLTTAIVKMGFCTETDMAHYLSSIYNIQTANIKKMHLDKNLIENLSENFCKQYYIVPILKTPESLVFAASDPSVFYAQEQIEKLLTCKIQFIISTEENITCAIDYFFKSEHITANASGSDITFVNLENLSLSTSNAVTTQTSHLRAVTTNPLETPARTSTAAPAQKPSPTKPIATQRAHYAPPPIVTPQPSSPKLILRGDVTQMVNTLISEAIKRKSSDIHIEQYEKKYRVRFRIDGSMQELFQTVIGLSNELVSRIKVMSNLDVSEKRRPQDGRTKFQVGANKFIDLRVNILPTLFGEKVVMRILDKSNLELGINSLGFSEYQLQQVHRTLQLPQGMVLVTGPTGSGKTTTLYSALHALNNITCNISTCEDPVEFYIDGINQVQINPDIGFNFADSLRAFLRQDPDIIMVGEIRDAETANVAYKASSTGHLVLSTLHTNDAVSTIFRLIDMGVPKYVVAEGTSLIISQRLINKVCTYCTSKESIAEEILMELGVPEQQLFNFESTHVGTGCAECNNTGNKGRVAIHEVLEINSNVRKAISSGIPAQEVRNIAIKNGMVTMRGRAIELLKAGVVSYQEVVSSTISDDDTISKV